MAVLKRSLFCFPGGEERDQDFPGRGPPEASGPLPLMHADDEVLKSLEPGSEAFKALWYLPNLKGAQGPKSTALSTSSVKLVSASLKECEEKMKCNTVRRTRRSSSESNVTHYGIPDFATDEKLLRMCRDEANGSPGLAPGIREDARLPLNRSWG